MEIRVLCYGHLREVFGTHELSLELAEGATLEDLSRKLFPKNGGDFVHKISFVVNWKEVSLKSKLNAKDEVALLPFV
jgi:molybdopterin converting factor small subunit